MDQVEYENYLQRRNEYQEQFVEMVAVEWNEFFTDTSTQVRLKVVNGTPPTIKVVLQPNDPFLVKRPLYLNVEALERWKLKRELLTRARVALQEMIYREIGIGEELAQMITVDHIRVEYNDVQNSWFIGFEHSELESTLYGAKHKQDRNE